MSHIDKNLRTYHFHAHGNGLSAHFERPLDHVIEVQAGTSLPLIGGHGRARVDGFEFKEIVSFKSAYSHVSGNKNKEDGSHATLVTAVVEKLNILDVVTADRVVARLASHHDEEEEESHIIPVGSKFENLRIAGCPVDVEMDLHPFVEHDTHAAFKDQYNKDGKFREMALARFQWGKSEKGVPNFVKERYNWKDGKAFPEKRCGEVLCTLVKEIRTECPGVRHYGNVLDVPQFGRIFLAEFLVRPGERSLSMIRLELGCSVAGTASVAEARSNGAHWP
jgi:hypothetical protein